MSAHYFTPYFTRSYNGLNVGRYGHRDFDPTLGWEDVPPCDVCASPTARHEIMLQEAVAPVCYRCAAWLLRFVNWVQGGGEG
jgi:hypothetical protein